MIEVGLKLCKEVQGSKCVYIQSDEISILITDFDTLETDAWFDYNIQKIASISASVASVEFSLRMSLNCDNRDGCIEAYFDSRVFNIPKEEVCNYFIWRQQDWIKNSIQMLTRKFYSHKEVENKKQPDMHEMLHEKGVNWALIPDWCKNGVFIAKLDSGIEKFENCPDFKKDRKVIERYLAPMV
jgi:tRNA(His) 5'-end guanylyltransferase